MQATIITTIHTFNTNYKCSNVGAYFVTFLNGQPPTLYKTYAKALKAYRKAGGYGHASIVPKADATNYIASFI